MEILRLRRLAAPALRMTWEGERSTLAAEGELCLIFSGGGGEKSNITPVLFDFAARGRVKIKHNSGCGVGR